MRIRLVFRIPWIFLEVTSRAILGSTAQRETNGRGISSRFADMLFAFLRVILPRRIDNPLMISPGVPTRTSWTVPFRSPPTSRGFGHFGSCITRVSRRRVMMTLVACPRAPRPRKQFLGPLPAFSTGASGAPCARPPFFDFPAYRRWSELWRAEG